MGIVFDIQRFCVNDGPGIRSNVFLKGCPLKCLWCHNPESNSVKRQLYFERTKCVNCQKCMIVCGQGVHIFAGGEHEVNFEHCVQCGTCIASCPSDALGIYGKEMSVEEVLAEVRKDREYYDSSGGGVTISGGEPMYQFAYTFELAKKLKEEGFHVCMETCGFAQTDNYRKIMPFIDQFLYDYKATGESLHQKLTGVSNKRILKNMYDLINMGKEVVLRCPIIPQYNLSADHLQAISEISRSGVLRVEIIPYHDMGKSKAKKIGSDMFLEEVKMPAQEDVEKWISDIEKMGGIHIVQA